LLYPAPPTHFYTLSLHDALPISAQITNIAAAISVGIGIDDLAIKSGARNAETIIVTHNRCRVDDEHNHLAFARFSDKRHDAVVRSEEHTSELQSQSNLVCRLLLE